MSQKNTPIQEAMSFSPSFVLQKEEDKQQLDKALANPLSPTAQVKSLETRLSLTYADIKDTINNNLALKENQAVNRIRETPNIFLAMPRNFPNKNSPSQSYLIKTIQYVHHLKE